MAGDQRLNEAEKQLGLPYLAAGESLYWIGHESHGRYWLRHMLRLADYGLWTVVAGFITTWWIGMHPDMLQESFTNLLPGVCLLLLTILGSWLCGREVVQMRNDQPDVYILTSQRALVLSSRKAEKAWHYDPQAVGDIQFRRHRDGSSDIIFEQRVQWSTDAAGRSTRQRHVVGFFGLPSITEVVTWLNTRSQPDQAHFTQRRA